MILGSFIQYLGAIKTERKSRLQVLNDRETTDMQSSISGKTHGGLDFSPHKLWLRELEKNIYAAARRMKLSTEEFVFKINNAASYRDGNELNESISRFVGELKAKVDMETGAQAITAAALYPTMKYAKEFYLSKDTSDKIYEKVSNGSWIKIISELKSLKLPFSDIVITSKGKYKDKKYGTSFYSVFEKTERYVDKDGTKYPIIVIKECLVQFDGDKVKEAIAHEITIIEPILPRVFISCPFLYEGCPDAVMVNPTLQADLPDEVKMEDLMKIEGTTCKKGARTMHTCKRVNIAEHSLQAVFVVSEILKQYHSKPVKIIEGTGEEQDTVHEAHDKEESIIYLTGKSYYNMDLDHRRIRNKPKGGHHDSPCEHDRSGHVRQLKSGKVVYVKGSKVNEGGKKSKIVL